MRTIYLLVPVLLVGCMSSTTIKVTSTPSGAAVTEAGKGALGVTPLQITFNDDDCLDDNKCIASFYFRKQGYKDKRVKRYVQGDELLVHAYLQERKTQLIVNGFPAFAKVESSYQNENGEWVKLVLSGKNGPIPSLLDDDPWLGKDYCHVRLIFESPGFRPVEKTITIKKGEQKTIEYALNEYAIDGEILSKPEGADVYERTLGYLGRTPFKIRIPYDQLMRISAQRRSKLEEPVYLFLTFKKSGFYPLEQISSIGELNESEDPKPFSIPAHLTPVTQRN